MGFIMQIGSRLAELRKKNGFTQKQLAQKLNVSQQIVSNIERDQTEPDIDFIKGAADLYNLSLDQLIGREFTKTESDTYEREIISILEKMDETGKELSLGLVNQVAQHRGNRDGD